MTGWCQPDQDGIRLTVRLTPNAARDMIEGEAELADGTRVLKARVRAVPEKGRANKALIKLLARTFGQAPSRVSVVKGTTARKKTMHIKGDPAELMKRAGSLPS
ncbi:MAG: hypothetical protein C0605_12110 [Hyphomicrobiales bacterium]|nr:MAG: hypothetical protein C0605_12110 [Hyphomicrobiales bacterium]